MAGRVREKNPNWGGGRFVGSSGYVKVLVPHYYGADSKGYAYEHRIEAEKKIGRRLRRGESVHHRDGNKTHNEHENLMVCGSMKEHSDAHVPLKMAAGDEAKGFKLTAADVREIRRLVVSGMFQTEVAKMFGVHHSEVNYIVHRKVWTWLE